MLFNSLTFWIFFVVVYGFYLFLRFPDQNVLLIIASFIFYGAWDWRFLILLVLTTIVDYWGALFLVKSSRRKMRLFILWCCLGFNLGLLGFFKYFNFFADSFYSIAGLAGWHPEQIMLHVVLPVGISFYTFQSMSYMIEIWRGRLAPCRSYFFYLSYVSFFPQLVAGPIERPWRLLPQVSTPRIITYPKVSSGLRLVLWGLFKKVVIGDNAAQLADFVFQGWTGMSGTAILIGVYAFALQIYGDFSGYTDIARGIARMMGFDLMINFRAPYLAVNPSDFWQRWHISLSTWLRDYLYIPLGGNRKGKTTTVRNLLITMLLGGLWHGAAWNFLLWGFYHGLLLVLYHLYDENWRQKKGSLGAIFPPSFWRLIRVFMMFHLTCAGWIFFRAGSAGEALGMLRKIIGDFSLQPILEVMSYSPMCLALSAAALSFLCLYFYKDTEMFSGMRISQWPFILRFGLYAALGCIFLFTGVWDARQFIYFQF